MRTKKENVLQNGKNLGLDKRLMRIINLSRNIYNFWKRLKRKRPLEVIRQKIKLVLEDVDIVTRLSFQRVTSRTNVRPYVI
jgi:hypothetical protein